MCVGSGAVATFISGALRVEVVTPLTLTHFPAVAPHGAAH